MERPYVKLRKPTLMKENSDSTNRETMARQYCVLQKLFDNFQSLNSAISPMLRKKRMPVKSRKLTFTFSPKFELKHRRKGKEMTTIS